MQKKSLWIVAVIVIIIVAIGGYVIFHKAYKAPSTPYSSTSSTGSKTATSSTTVSNSVVMSETNSSVGTYLTDTSDNALYTDGSGSTGVTNCTGSCLSAWPAYVDKGSTTGLPTNIGTIIRSDNNEVQYTYKGAPLYYFSSDSKGNVTGNGVSGFYVATP
jgi:predicted lipoprotein with Yx(FWY)xxD motif